MLNGTLQRDTPKRKVDILASVLLLISLFVVYGGIHLVYKSFEEIEKRNKLVKEMRIKQDKMLDKILDLQDRTDVVSDKLRSITFQAKRIILDGENYTLNNLMALDVQKKRRVVSNEGDTSNIGDFSSDHKTPILSSLQEKSLNTELSYDIFQELLRLKVSLEGSLEKFNQVTGNKIQNAKA
eukprot:Tbor_TRINITY_DN5313_c0_g3::TRINITY_DN5313_c0_g3_i1::g.4534::m.4534